MRTPSLEDLGLSTTFTTSGLRRRYSHPRRRVQRPCACEAFEARRLMAAGTAGVALDTNYGTGGQLQVPVTVRLSGYDFAVDPSGRLLVAGQQVQGGRGLAALLRFNVDGSPDNTFSGDGVATVNPGVDGGAFRLHAVLPLPDGGTLVGGTLFLPPGDGAPAAERPVLARFDSAGNLDTAFGGAGGVLTLPGTDAFGVVRDLALLPGGKILVGGYRSGDAPPDLYDLALWRLNPDGTADAAFGTDGFRRQDITDHDFLATLVPMPDGSFFAGASGGLFSFAPDGTLRGPVAEGVSAVAPTADGKILTAAQGEGRRGIVVRRLLADGSPDPTFGTGGATTLDFGAAEDWVNSLAALPDGGVAVGVLNNFRVNEFTVQRTTLSRLDAAGVPQSNFGAAGLVTDTVPFGMRLVVAGPAGRLYTVGTDNTRPIVFARRLDPGIVVDPGGPYGPVDEGGQFDVSGAASYAGGRIVKYEWDTDFDGYNFTPDAEGAAATLTARGDDPLRRVALRVTTDDGLQAISPVPAELSLRNAPPVVVAFGAESGIIPTGAEQFYGRVTDPGGDAVTVQIDFGDGTAPAAAAPDQFGNFTVSHAYASRGTYTARVTATDDDGASSTRDVTVVVADVTGRVYRDVGDNGVRDFQDQPFTGVTVFIDSDGDGVLDEAERRTVTDAAGEYAFSGLAPGTYPVRVVLPDGWRVTTPPQLQSPAVVSAGAGARRDFGMSQKSRITGTVFNDADADGVRDTGEGPLMGTAPRNVYLDLDNDGWYDPNEPKADALWQLSPQYAFTNLDPGTYTVRYLPGLNTSGAVEGEAAQTYPNARGGQTGHVVTVAAAAESSGHDFGSFFGNTAITGAVYVDRDRDGTRDPFASGETAASGRVVYLDHDGDGALDPDESRSRTPDPRTGTGYFLPVVRGNTYTVRTVLPEGWTQSQPAGGAPYVITVDQQNTAELQNRHFGTHPVAAPAVVGRHLFYFKSAFSTRIVGNPREDNAIAPDKAALLPGQQAGFANVSTYSRGINGLMIDLNNLTGLQGNSSTNFLRFAVGGGGEQPWTTINPLGAAVRRGAGAGGSDRIVALFADNVIRNKWLRVTVEPGAGSGLAEPDVFYFGNLVGETGDPASPLRVAGPDVARTRAAMRSTAGAAGRYDFNRDGRVNAVDYALARSSVANALPAPDGPAAASSAAPARPRTAPAPRRVWQEEEPILF